MGRNKLDYLVGSLIFELLVDIFKPLVTGIFYILAFCIIGVNKLVDYITDAIFSHPKTKKENNREENKFHAENENLTIDNATIDNHTRSFENSSKVQNYIDNSSHSSVEVPADAEKTFELNENDNSIEKKERAEFHDNDFEVKPLVDISSNDSVEISPTAENTLVLYVTWNKHISLSKGQQKKYSRLLCESLFEDVFVFEDGNPAVKKDFTNSGYSWDITDRFSECPYVTRSYEFVEFRNRYNEQTYITKINPEIVIYFSKHGKWAFRIDFI